MLFIFSVADPFTIVIRVITIAYLGSRLLYWEHADPYITLGSFCPSCVPKPLFTAKPGFRI